jgi:endonuclease YncB( thermonuclease family)
MTKWFFTISLSLPIWSADHDCLPENPDKLTWHTVQYVSNGNKLIVKNHFVMLEGVVTPQPAQRHKWFHREDDPLAQQTKLFMLKLFANHEMKVGIEHDKVPYDRFLRELAHAYYKDQKGRIHSVQQALLEAGLAIAETNPPNLKHQKCYYAAEKRARKASVGIWRIAKEYPALKYPIIPSDQIAGDDVGYRIIKGPVRRTLSISKFEAINLDTTGIRIPEKDFKRYWRPRMLSQLKGKTIEVRGRPYYVKGHMYMIVRHPWAINLLNPVYGVDRTP